VSKKTIYRVLKALAEKGAIKKHTTTRPKSGGQGAMIYTIEPNVHPSMSTRDVPETPRESRLEHTKKKKETAILLSKAGSVVFRGALFDLSSAHSVPFFLDNDSS
jgi:hypothetical protein